jgi:RHS repeat-associated protein
MQDYNTYNGVGQLKSVKASDDRYTFNPGALDLGYTTNSLNQYDTLTDRAPTPDVVYTPTYDLNGNLLSDGAVTFTYDAENRLTTATLSGVSATYTYNALGQRTAKTVNGTTTNYLLGAGGEVLAEYDGTGVLKRRYLYDGGLAPFGMTDGSSSTLAAYFHKDALGSVIAVNELGAAPTQRHAYSPFGEAQTPTGTPFRFTGHWLDEETGLLFMKNRYYSPKLGRFLQADPIGYGDGLNLYAYVGNEPINSTDPLGPRKNDSVNGNNDNFGPGESKTGFHGPDGRGGGIGIPDEWARQYFFNKLAAAPLKGGETIYDMIKAGIPLDLSREEGVVSIILAGTH